MNAAEIRQKYLGDRSLLEMRKGDSPSDRDKYPKYANTETFNKAVNRLRARGGFDDPSKNNPKNYKTLVSACEEAISILDRWVHSVPSSAGFEGGLNNAKKSINALKALAQQKMKNVK